MLYVHLQNPDTCRRDTKYTKGNTPLGFVCVCIQILIKHTTSVYRPCIPYQYEKLEPSCVILKFWKIIPRIYTFLSLILYNTKIKYWIFLLCHFKTTTDESLNKLLQKLGNTDHIHDVPSHQQLVTQAIPMRCHYPTSWLNITYQLPWNLWPVMD